ncbi:unnamed protein product [Darwinula stevensoni]|uniref:Biopterin-dependent aromatic amino acid hydroxylase family profile domain-containing protein n=1 Tax=Darwinula stevensoni TaxID=69355 RepID=A0A7R8XAU0_9CRUS|nr:unnamed protein product [Darwinula stevensoni]CAG0890962.1 unnamed protein product [Darwinula stevensoni]
MCKADIGRGKNCEIRRVSSQVLKLVEGEKGKEENYVVFSLRNQVGALARALRIFQVCLPFFQGPSSVLTGAVSQEKGVNLVKIESRPSRRRESQMEILVELDCPDSQKALVDRALKRELSCLSLKEFDGGEEFPPESPASLASLDSFDFDDIIWFPKKLSDLDISSKRVLMYGSALNADHPGFTDPIYRKRRKYFADLAMAYRQGELIPRIQYSKEEIKTWGVIYRELFRLYPTHACPEFLKNWPVLQRHCGYREDNIPQLQDVSNFLKRKTGFTLRPVAGYLTPRDFLAALAFRVFSCTQYIRHSSDPFYTPEPDCCHELLGHVPLLADPSFAQFSQEIGLASLGASEDDVKNLATLYFFTIEFGLCTTETGELKVYGAGLLSCVAELKHAVSQEAVVRPFDPDEVTRTECMITTFQQRYFYTRSLEQAKDKMREFAATIQRPFGVRYNAYTQSVEVLSSVEKVSNVVKELRGDLCIVGNALRKIRETGGDDGGGGFVELDALKTVILQMDDKSP